jgi:hypothetical protein
LGDFWGRFVEAGPCWEFSKLLSTHMRRYSSMLDLVIGRHESHAPSEVERVIVSAAGEPS